MARKLTIKDKILNLLRKGTPMLSLDIAQVLKIEKGAASQAAKELHVAKLIHIAEWRTNAKNGGNKVYAYGEGEDAVKPEPKFAPRNKKQEMYVPKVFIPHADVAAAWMRNPI